MQELGLVHCVSYDESSKSLKPAALSATSVDALPREAFGLIGLCVRHAELCKEVVQMLHKERREDLAEAVSDALWMWGSLINATTQREHWVNLCALVEGLYRERVVPEETLRLYLDIPLLVDAKLAGRGETADVLGKRLTRVRTAMVFKQHKYNLIREETEGYSRLISLLASAPEHDASSSADQRNPLCAAVLSLIGRFDLDPNRALDLTLHALEQQPAQTSLLAVVHMFKRDSVSAVLGFKLLQYHESVAEAELWTTPTVEPASAKPIGKGKPADVPVIIPSHEQSKGPAPKSLYVLAGLLLSAGVIDLEDVIPYLAPSVKATIAAQSASDIARRKAVRLMGVVNLSAIGSTKDAKAEGRGDEVPLGFADGNQYLGLLAGLLHTRAWGLALDLLRYIASEEGGSKFDAVALPDVRTAMAELIYWFLEEVYAPMGFARLGLANADTTPVIPHVGHRQLSRAPCTEGSLFSTEAQSMLRVLGYRIGLAPLLFTRICRMASKELAVTLTVSDAASAVHNTFMGELLSDILLPGVTLATSNPVLSSALWTVISQLPFQQRFPLYAIWRGEAMGKAAVEGEGSKEVDLAEAEEATLQGAKGFLKRLAKENVRTVGRMIGKQTHSFPSIVFGHILGQIEAYENLIPYVVDALKYATQLSKDVLAHALLAQLGKNSDKVKKGDTHYSQWFSSLAKFVAAFYRRYPSTEIKGLLHLLLSRLAEGESVDLLVLRELLTKMGGCETLLEVSHQQLDGMAGGRVLRSEVMASNVMESAVKKAISSLRRELISSGTALPLLILIAQTRLKLLFSTDSSELKLISHLHDTCQDVLMQFSDFLVAGDASLETIATMMPPLGVLIGDLGLSLPVAFTLVRPLVRAALSAGPSHLDSPAHLTRWHPFHEDMLAVVRAKLPSEVWETVSPQLIMLFWSLSAYDLSTPTARYELEKKRLALSVSKLENKTAMPLMTPKLRKQEVARLNGVLQDLTEEMNVQKKHTEVVAKIMLTLKDSFFASCTPAQTGVVIDHIMQHCVLDRMVMSPMDAVFCSQFFYHLHRADTHLFSTYTFLDKMISYLPPLLFACTEFEAGFMGYGFGYLLVNVNKWIASKAIYDVEAMAKVGMTDFDKGDKVEYSRFKAMHKTWHGRIAEVVVACLGSKEYMHIRSALVFLTKLSASQQYPTLAADGRLILKVVQQIEVAERTNRRDLNVMATSLGALLSKQAKDWVEEKGALKPVAKVPARVPATAPMQIEAVPVKTESGVPSRIAPAMSTQPPKEAPPRPAPHTKVNGRPPPPRPIQPPEPSREKPAAPERQAKDGDGSGKRKISEPEAQGSASASVEGPKRARANSSSEERGKGKAEEGKVDKAVDRVQTSRGKSTGESKDREKEREKEQTGEHAVSSLGKRGREEEKPSPNDDGKRDIANFQNKTIFDSRASIRNDRGEGMFQDKRQQGFAPLAPSDIRGVSHSRMGQGQGPPPRIPYAQQHQGRGYGGQRDQGPGDRWGDSHAPPGSSQRGLPLGSREQGSRDGQRDGPSQAGRTEEPAAPRADDSRSKSRNIRK